jgi:DNA-binding transcriptional regulator GbsR (MarR family)
MDDEPGSGFKSGVGQGSIHAAYLLAADLIIIDDVSMLIQWAASRVSMALQSIADTLTN